MTTPRVAAASPLGDRLPADLADRDPTIGTALAALTQEAHAYSWDLHAANTKRAYRADWADFTAWCAAHGPDALPAAPVALYLTDRARSCKVSTLARRLCAIAAAHKTAGQPSPTADPTVRTLLAGIRRAKGTRQERKRPTVTHEVCAMVDALPPTLLGRRDRALLLLGFAGGLRRGELVALDVVDVEETVTGLVVMIRRSKTDQEGEGRDVGIPYGGRHCPVRALQTWLAAAEIVDGPLFRRFDRGGHLLPLRLSDRGVARVVQRQAAAVGLDPRTYGGHSLRAGLATAAGSSERAIIAQTGHPRPMPPVHASPHPRRQARLPGGKHRHLPPHKGASGWPTRMRRWRIIRQFQPLCHDLGTRRGPTHSPPHSGGQWSGR